jgi:hypothetical protein
MKLYVVIMGENFEEAKKAHGDNFFPSVEEANLWCQITLDPGQRYMICDENGGLLYIGITSRLVGQA